MSQNPNITYRFGIGDTVKWDHEGEQKVGKVVRLCFSDENYDIDNGWTCPGCSMELVERGVDPFPEIWTCRDGRKLKVSEMDEHHVRAALSMVIRRTNLARTMRAFRMDYELRAKHDIGLDDVWPELNTSDSSTKGASQ